LNNKKGKCILKIRKNGQITESKGKERLKEHFNYNIKEQNRDIFKDKCKF